MSRGESSREDQAGGAITFTAYAVAESTTLASQRKAEDPQELRQRLGTLR